MIRLLLIAVLFIVQTVTHAQQQAHIYRDSIYMQLKGYAEKSKALDSIKQSYAKEIQEQQIKTQEKYLALAKSYQAKNTETLEQLKARMNATDLEKLSLIEQETKFLDTRIKSYNKLLDEQYKKDIEPYITKINTAITTYATKNKIEYVWIMEEQAGRLAYSAKKNNITKAIINLINK